MWYHALVYIIGYAELTVFYSFYFFNSLNSSQLTQLPQPTQLFSTPSTPSTYPTHSFLKPSAQPWYFLYMRHKQRADGKDEDHEHYVVIISAIDAVTEADVTETIELQDRIMRHKEHHGVLTYVVDERHIANRKFDEESGKSEQDDDSVDEGSKAISLEAVCSHDILAMPYEIEHYERDDQCAAENEGYIAIQSFKHPTPRSSHIEEEHSHEYIAQGKRQRIVLSPKPITDEWTGKDDN